MSEYCNDCSRLHTLTCEEDRDLRRVIALERIADALESFKDTYTYGR